jgi:CheY-like chemotaxis protein
MSLILVVEDSDDLRKAIGDMLELGGHEVVLAGSGKKAVQLCQQKSFDLVITDLSMPDMDGLELIRSLRGSQKDLPILAVSGIFSGQFFKAAKLLGAVGTLEKPFKPRELLGHGGQGSGEAGRPHIMTQVWRIGFWRKGSGMGPAATLLEEKRTTRKESEAKKAGFRSLE